MRRSGATHLHVTVAMAALTACGLPLSGLESADGGLDSSGPSPEAASPDTGASADDGAAPEAAPGDDGATFDGPPCAPVDAGVLGALSLTDFTTAGVAKYDEGADGLTTLTQAANNLAGAAWYDGQLPPLVAYDLTWTLREGPNQVAGAGFAFAVLAAPVAPANTFVGENGDGMGLRNITGAPTGYAVGLYLYNGIELMLIAMPDFTAIATQVAAGALNDGKLYAIDVSWRAPSTITATLHGPNGPLTVTSSDPSFASPGAAWFGVSASTGPSSNSHNELAGMTVTSACE
jgi:hypothetical protein